MRAQQVGFSIDKPRIQGALNELHAQERPFTEIQKLVFIASIQEACNRLRESSLKFFVANLGSISDLDTLTTINNQIKNIQATALASIAEQINFNPMDLSLTPESVLYVKRERARFKEASKINPGIEVSDEELPEPPIQHKSSISFSTQIQLLDELIPALALDSNILEESERSEHLAKLELLKLQSHILSMTMQDAWTVKYQWMYPGNIIDVGPKNVALPSSISQILKIISDALAQKHRASYLDAQHQIQQVALDYKADWYRWLRNLTTFSASAAQLNILDSVLTKFNPTSSMEKNIAPDSTVVASSYFPWMTFFSRYTESDSTPPHAPNEEEPPAPT